DFPSFLSKGDVLVINQARVIPARVWGKKGDREIDFLFLEEAERGIWKVLCRPARRIQLGDTIHFSSRLVGEVVKVEEAGKRMIQFSEKDVLSELKKIGYAPLPPYIKRTKENQILKELDLKRYQTIYARRGKAVAAPTAGLHFTEEILEEIREKEVILCPISLDVGLATFQPVRTDRVENHRMLEETYSISRKSASQINSALKDGRPIVAVGTTSVRALESACKQGRVLPGRASTNLFIYPGYSFRVVDRLLTNFHLPKSTLLMLAAAFTGLDFIKKAYREAVRRKYRFYSYGDCMFIL
ncbi:MAG: tRNA preQ1(34) S-adenosylmethionine ribosyltransferase-isomerase QueA, partial [Candidatus Aminicenantales bacterium]